MIDICDRLDGKIIFRFLHSASQPLHRWLVNNITHAVDNKNRLIARLAEHG
jgi:hypothetical protein